LTKGFILEYLTGARYPLLTVVSCLLGTIEQAKKTFSTIGKVSEHFGKRPIQATLKGGVEVVKTLSQGSYLLSVGREVYTNVKSDFFVDPESQINIPEIPSDDQVEQPKCRINSAEDIQEYKELPGFDNPLIRLSDEKFKHLNPKCPKDAKLLLDDAWIKGWGKTQSETVLSFSKLAHPDRKHMAGYQTLWNKHELARDTVSGIPKPQPGWISWAADSYERYLQKQSPKLLADKPTVPVHAALLDKFKENPEGYQELVNSALRIAAIPLLDRLPYAQEGWWAASKGFTLYYRVLNPFYNLFNQFWYDSGEDRKPTSKPRPASQGA
jgi:hypothetical protein